MGLYAWQKACLKKWEKNNYHGIVNVVTGAGKTRLALEAAALAWAKFPDLRVKVVVPTIALANQWKLAFLDYAKSEEFRPGFFGGGTKDDPTRRVMIYVINSARDSLSGHIRKDLSLGHHVLLICDECHHCQSPDNRKIFSFLGASDMTAIYLSLGLSATPFGTGQDNILTDALGPEIYSYGFSEAAAAGIISPFSVCEIGASFMEQELCKYSELSDWIRVLYKRLLKEDESLKYLSKIQFMKEVNRLAKKADMDPSDPAAAFLLATYQRKEITVLARTRIRCTLALLRELREEDRILIFCERIEQADMLYAAVLREFGSRAGLYHSKLTPSAKRRVLDDFRSRRTRILISCKALDEGIDVPDANIGIVVSSTSVSRQRIQRLGRIIRKSGSKHTACLYYLYIRESAEDSSYLDGLPQAHRIAVRYYPAEDAFSHDLYEYTAGKILNTARQRGFTSSQLAELRACLLEGLIRTDWLMDSKDLKELSRTADTVHNRNYWKVCAKTRNFLLR